MSEDFFLYALIYIVGFILAVLITRTIFSIPSILRHLKAQTILLTHIAEKLGVDAATAKKAYYDAEGMLKPAKKDI